MQKLVLYDKSTINILDGMTINAFSVPGTVDNMPGLYARLTDENLSRFALQTEAGSVMGVYTDKHLRACTYQDGVLTFALEDVVTPLEEANAKIADMRAALEVLGVADQ